MGSPAEHLPGISLPAFHFRIRSAEAENGKQPVSYKALPGCLSRSHDKKIPDFQTVIIVESLSPKTCKHILHDGNTLIMVAQNSVCRQRNCFHMPVQQLFKSIWVTSGDKLHQSEIAHGFNIITHNTSLFRVIIQKKFHFF